MPIMPLIHPSHIPSRLPIISSITVYLFLKDQDAGNWAYALAGVIMGFAWIVALYDTFTKKVDLTRLLNTIPATKR